MNKPPEIIRPTVEQLAKEIQAATRPVLGYEDTGLRYGGNEQMGFFPCIESGAVVVGNAGNPIVFPSLAHVRAWAYNWLLQKSSIVIPTGGITPLSGQPN